MHPHEAAFLDFLKKRPAAPTKNRSGVLPSLVLPGQPTGPLARALNTVRTQGTQSVKVTDWETRDNGGTLIVDFDVYYEAPSQLINYERSYQRALQPLAREISELLNAPATVTVNYDMERSLSEELDPEFGAPYRVTLKVPRGAATNPMQPSPLRVARRYASRTRR
jgi:hypothetical protein